MAGSTILIRHTKSKMNPGSGSVVAGPRVPLSPTGYRLNFLNFKMRFLSDPQVFWQHNYVNYVDQGLKKLSISKT
jgi:hypothetical protein